MLHCCTVEQKDTLLIIFYIMLLLEKCDIKKWLSSVLSVNNIKNRLEEAKSLKQKQNNVPFLAPSVYYMSQWKYVWY